MLLSSICGMISDIIGVPRPATGRYSNFPLWLNEKAFQRKKTESMGFGRYLSFSYRRIFLSGKTLRRRDVFAL